jgi:hypothetical protein
MKRPAPMSCKEPGRTSCSLSVPVDSAANYERPDLTRDRIVERESPLRLGPTPAASAFTALNIQAPLSRRTPPDAPPPRLA